MGTLAVWAAHSISQVDTRVQAFLIVRAVREKADPQQYNPVAPSEPARLDGKSASRPARRGPRPSSRTPLLLLGLWALSCVIRA